MKYLIKKELYSFFSSPIGYLVIGVYLLATSLFLWVFTSEFNILQAGYADLTSYFYIAPWVFMFLIPAVTMKSFSEELNTGTIEILKTKPITTWQLVLGKFFGSFLLIIISILPTLIYVYSIYQLGNPIGNIKLGTALGSFIGLLFLTSTYVSIGIFTSTLSKNQIVAFILAICLLLAFYSGFLMLSKTISNNYGYLIEDLGMMQHYQSIGKGVLDSRDISYFLSISFF